MGLVFGVPAGGERIASEVVPVMQREFSSLRMLCTGLPGSGDMKKGGLLIVRPEG